MFLMEKKMVYILNNMPNPINYYGFSKLSGENSMKKYKLKIQLCKN